MTLTRLSHTMVDDAMFIRPRRPDDHTELAWLLPLCTPLFIYGDANGRDWVRWSIPVGVARQIGLDKGCACCQKVEEATIAPEHSYVADLAWDEISWFFEAVANAAL